MGLLNSRLATSFSPIDGFHRFDKHDIHAQLMRKRTFPYSGVQTSLIKWLRGYQAKRFGSFSFKFCHIFFNCGLYQWREDNYCHSQRIGQLIKEKLLKGIFKYTDFAKFIVNISHLQTNDQLLFTQVLFGVLFFSEIMPECWGCGLYTNLYSKFICKRKLIFTIYMWHFKNNLAHISHFNKWLLLSQCIILEITLCLHHCEFYCWCSCNTLDAMEGFKNIFWPAKLYVVYYMLLILYNWF